MFGPEDKVSILLVDDHEENLIALEAILAHPDYDLVKCTSGQEALKKLLHHDFAVVLLDVMMPDIDGFELASLLRKREQTKNTPIIFLTALAKEISYVYRGYSVGAVDYISKPLEPAIVIAKVHIFVELFKKNKLVEYQAKMLRDAEAREHELRIERVKQQSEIRYRHLAESIPQIVWRANELGHLEYFSPQWREFDTSNLDEVETSDEGWEFYRFAFHPEDFAKFNEEWQARLKMPEPFEFECRLKKLNSTGHRWHLCRAKPEIEANGNVVAWLGTWTDIHNQKVAEARKGFLAQAGKVLGSSLDYYAILRRIVDLIVPEVADWCAIDIKDGQGKLRRIELTHADPSKAGAIAKLKDLPLDDSKYPTGKTLVFNQSEPTLISYISPIEVGRFSDDESYQDLLTTLGCRSLISVPIEVRGQNIGAMTLVVGEGHRLYDESDLQLAVELSRHAGLAIDNARLYTIAQDSNRLKDEFLATVSHELRTPLSAVLGWTDLLLDNQYDEDTVRCLETIRRNAKSLATLVEDLLDVSRIITGKIMLNMQSTEIAPLIQAAIDTVQPAANSKEIDISYHVDDEVESLTIDPSRVQQIAWNLISNAIKFTPRGGNVTVKLMNDGDGNIVLVVKDDGIGLKPDFIPHAFERFIQADGTTTRQFGGLGLGLAIVRHLVELHGGSVRAESDGLDLGSTFTVTFPINAKSVGEGKKMDDLGVHANDVANSLEPSLKGVNVLIVDDQEDSRTLISAVLTRYGATVDNAASVQEAVDTCKVRRPDVILSDIGMPQQDGFDFLDQMRHLEAHEGMPHIPMAAITAHVGKASQNKVISAGFDAYLAKPVRFNELIKSVAVLAGQRTHETRAQV